MTTSEALKTMQSATAANVRPDADMTTFGGWTVAEVVAYLNAATACTGEDDVFTVGGLVTVCFDKGTLYVSGTNKP